MSGSEVAFETQGMCDLLSKGARFWRENFGLVVQKLFVPSLLLLISAGFVQWTMVFGKDLTTDPLQTGLIIAGAILSGTLWVICICHLIVRQMAFVRYITGFAPDVASAFAAIKKKFWRTIGWTILFSLGSAILVGLWFGLAILAAQLPTWIGKQVGAVLAILLILTCAAGVAFSAVSSLLMWYLAISILACEEIPFFSVFKRTFAMFWRNFGRLAGFGVIVFVFVEVFDTAFSVPCLCLQSIDYFVHALTGGRAAPQTALWVMIAVHVISAVKDIFVRPIVQFAFGMLYLDFRCRSDGLDIERRLRQLIQLDSKQADTESVRVEEGS